MERDAIHAWGVPCDNEKVLLKKFTYNYRNITITNGRNYGAVAAKSWRIERIGPVMNEAFITPQA